MKGRPSGVLVAHSATWLALLVVAYSGATLRWWWLGAAVLALVATLSTALVRATALLAALIVGAWPAAVAAGVALVASGMQATARHPAMRRPLDTAALVAAVNSLPAGERAAIERAASGAVDSLAIVRAAVVDDPGRWPFDVSEVGGTGYEGGRIAATRWTVVACEAALMAACRPDTERPIDLHHVAGAALMVLNSAASDRFGLRGVNAAAEALGLSDGQAIEQTVRMTKCPGAEVFVQRMERTAGRLPWMRLSPPDLGELPETEWRRMLGGHR